MHYSPHQLAYFARELTLRAATDSMDGIAGALLDAQVELNPHQIDAALFATSNPLSKGVILADEVGLGKTIEAGLLIAQRWAERKRHILVIVHMHVLRVGTTAKLLTLPGHAVALPNADVSEAAMPPIPPSLQQELARQRAAVLGTIEQRNLSLFSDETEKLDAWADDLKVALGRAIKELGRSIKECRIKGKGAATLAKKLEHQKLQRTLEITRDKKRCELFERQDEIQARRDELIDELESQLRQEVDIHTVLASQWRLQ